MAMTAGAGKYNGEKRMAMELEIFKPIFFKVSYLLSKEISSLKPNLFVSKLIINCNFLTFLCLVSLKLPFKMQSLRSLML